MMGTHEWATFLLLCQGCFLVFFISCENSDDQCSPVTECAVPTQATAEWGMLSCSLCCLGLWYPPLIFPYTCRRKAEPGTGGEEL